MSPDPSREASFAAIDALHDRDVAATLSRNLDELCALFSDDGVLLAPGNPAIVGRAAFREFLSKTMSRTPKAKVIAYTPRFDGLRIDGDVAYEWGEFESVVRPDESADPTTMRARFCRVLRRQTDGAWSFALVMWAPA